MYENNAKDNDIVTLMYNLTEYNDNYSKTFLYDDVVIDNFSFNSASFKFKQNVTCKTGADGSKNVEIIVSLKHLSNL